MRHVVRWPILLALLVGCAWQTERPSQLTILSWNVQNLFDDVTDGGEPPEFDPEGGQWNRTLFLERLERLAGVIRRVPDGVPDVVALQEVENVRTARTLNDRFLIGLGYHVVGFDDPQLRIVPVLLSRLSPRRAGQIFLPDFRGEPQRPILEVELEWEGRTVVVWNNHWKSRREGASSSRPARVVAAESLTDRATRLRERYPEAVLVAVGDFNSDLASEGLLPSWIEVPGQRGTYFFRGVWDCLDHALVFPPESLDSRLVVLAPAFLLTESGSPRGYSTRDRGGYSDHLPILLYLVSRDRLGYTGNDGVEGRSGVPRGAAAAVRLASGF